MFTGLVEELGKVAALDRSGRDWVLTVAAPGLGPTLSLGDSVAVNGVCLTVVRMGGERFDVEVSAETVSRTTMGALAAGAAVNLERALAFGGRLHGHLVQGHVDAVARVAGVENRGRSVGVWFETDGALSRYLVPKGSVAVDGVSLTVNEVRDGGDKARFSVNLIPHTLKKTTLADLRPGGMVNVESDVLGRYVERLLGPGAGGCGVDEAFLRKVGFV